MKRRFVDCHSQGRSIEVRIRLALYYSAHIVLNVVEADDHFLRHCSHYRLFLPMADEIERCYIGFDEECARYNGIRQGQCSRIDFRPVRSNERRCGGFDLNGCVNCMY